MVSADEVRNIVGVMGNVISFGLFLSPLPTFIQIVQKKDVEKYAPDPYLATLLNCMLWVLYGLPFVHPHSFLVITINGTGVVIETVYLAVFFAYSPGPKKVKLLVMLGVEVLFVAAVAAGVLLGAHTYEDRSLVVGSICVFFGTLMYAAPLTVIKRVIATKSVEYMPLTLSLVSLLNSICWTTYALIRFDIFITIPNGTGTLLCLGQLFLYFWYAGSTPVAASDSSKVDDDDGGSSVRSGGGGGAA